jgi:hypothetical protein
MILLSIEGVRDMSKHPVSFRIDGETKDKLKEITEYYSKKMGTELSQTQTITVLINRAWKNIQD